MQLQDASLTVHDACRPVLLVSEKCISASSFTLFRTLLQHILITPGINDRLEKIDNRLDVIELKQNKMSEHLTEFQLSQKLFELNTNKKLARLQDGLDTVEEVLKMNELIPR